MCHGPRALTAALSVEGCRSAAWSSRQRCPPQAGQKQSPDPWCRRANEHVPLTSSLYNPQPRRERWLSDVSMKGYRRDVSRCNSGPSTLSTAKLTSYSGLLVIRFVLATVSSPCSRPYRPSSRIPRSSRSSASTAPPSFEARAFGPARWLGDGSSYTTLEEADSDGGQNLVRYDTERGRTGGAAGRPAVHSPGRQRSASGRRLFLVARQADVADLHQQQPVWRLNTRGDYWVLDRAHRQAPASWAAATPSPPP